MVGVDYRVPRHTAVLCAFFQFTGSMRQKTTAGIYVPSDWRERYPRDGNVSTPMSRIAWEAVKTGSTVFPLVKSYEGDQRLAQLDALCSAAESIASQELITSLEGLNHMQRLLERQIAALDGQPIMTSDDAGRIAFYRAQLRGIQNTFRDLRESARLNTPEDLHGIREEAARQIEDHIIGVIEREEPAFVMLSISHVNSIASRLSDYTLNTIEDFERHHAQKRPE